MENFQGRFSASVSNQHSLPFPDNSWNIANQTVNRVFSVLLPTVYSEQRRQNVINRVSKLIKDHYQTEVLPFGSVPLRTYLPHGDIDLTAFTLHDDEESTALGIYSVLTNQIKEHVEFKVHDVQYVPAQVKIVKCIVQNISVDISFNQIAGLNSLCFLEKVNELIGRDHIFKRSIILIKAWCFYESRILGAQYSLISTYALEVLYKFLEYYSRFDWENHCLCLDGPVYVKLLPRIVAATPENSRSNLLLTEQFLEKHVQYFSVRETTSKAGGGLFPIKHLNIIDPLKGNNNLGRSVTKANLCRITSALRYGYKKLKGALMLPRKRVKAGLKKFFFNTLERNEGVPRLDAEILTRRNISQRSEICNLRGNYSKCFMDLISGHWYYRCTGCNVIEPSNRISYFLSLLEQWYTQNVLYPGSTNSLVQTFSQTDILLMYTSFMGVDEITNFQVKSTTGHAAISEEKLPQRSGAININENFQKSSRSRGTGPFIPYCAVEDKMMPNTSIHDMSVQERLKLHDPGVVYGPDMHFEGKPTLIGNADQCITFGDTNIHILLGQDKGKASTSGTSACSPYAHDYSRSVHPPKGTQDKHEGLPLQSSSRAEQIDEDEDENHICFKLSMVNFPLLPSNMKVTLSENHMLVQPCAEPLQSMNTELLTSSPSHAPSVLSSCVQTTQAVDVVSTLVDCVLDVPKVTAEEPPQPSENEEEVLVLPYQLEDNEDFPILRR